MPYLLTLSTRWKLSHRGMCEVLIKPPPSAQCYTHLAASCVDSIHADCRHAAHRSGEAANSASSSFPSVCPRRRERSGGTSRVVSDFRVSSAVESRLVHTPYVHRGGASHVNQVPCPDFSFHVLFSSASVPTVVLRLSCIFFVRRCPFDRVAILCVTTVMLLFARSLPF